MYPHNVSKTSPYLPPSDHKRHPSNHGVVRGGREHGGHKSNKGGQTIEPEAQKVIQPNIYQSKHCNRKIEVAV